MIAIVLNDIRVSNILSCLNLLSKNPRSRIVTSDLYLRYGDYGDPFLEYFLRPQSVNRIFSCFLVKILELLRIVIVVKSVREISLSNSSLVGIQSSLCSITCDSSASKYRYPQLYRHLVGRAKGGEAIVNYIRAVRVEKVFLFNGRTASSSQIAYFCCLNNVAINYYEFSILSPSSYSLYPFSPHSSHKISRELTSLFLSGKLSLDSVDISLVARDNYFSRKCEQAPIDRYDIIVVLGSPHEYSNLMPEVVGISYIGNVKLIEYAAKLYSPSGLKVAVRAHPNMINDPSCKQLDSCYATICANNAFTYYSAASTVDTRSLVRNSKIVIVEYSSLAYYALLHGKEVQIQGDLDVKHTIQSLLKSNYDMNTAVSLSLKIHLLSQVFFDVRLPFVLSLLRKSFVFLDVIIRKIPIGRLDYSL